MAGERPKPEQDDKGRFVAGNTGNGGRPVGSRNKLGEQFIADLQADWQEHGAAAITQVREERPQDYLKVVASILPKIVRVEDARELSDDELTARIKQLAVFADFALGSLEGTGEPTRGKKAPARPN